MQQQCEITSSIFNPDEPVYVALKLIERFSKINKVKIKIDVALDWNMPEAGIYYCQNKKYKNKIFINPKNCGSITDATDYYIGYSKDITIFGVILHEFSHFLCYQVYPTLINDYKKYFATERLYLNDYSNNEIRDEIAEIMTLYFTNPFLLKLISKKHIQFFKKYFKSISPCSYRHMLMMYQDYPIPVKEDMIKRWNIIFDEYTAFFKKIKD
jgi:hypothetical protein